MLVILIVRPVVRPVAMLLPYAWRTKKHQRKNKNKKDASFAPEKFHLVSRKNTINVITTIVNMEGVVNEIWKGNYYFLEYN